MIVMQEASGTWQTVYQLAALRHGTKRGEDHLSIHAHEVLTRFAMQEHENLRQEALGEIIMGNFDPQIFQDDD